MCALVEQPYSEPSPASVQSDDDSEVMTVRRRFGPSDGGEGCLDGVDHISRHAARCDTGMDE